MPIAVVYRVSDETIASCSWGNWIDAYNSPLYVTGLKAGSTTVYIGLLDERDNVLAETVLNVTVNGSTSTVIYYPGYYPTPDSARISALPGNTKTMTRPLGRLFMATY